MFLSPTSFDCVELGSVSRTAPWARLFHTVVSKHGRIQGGDLNVQESRIYLTDNIFMRKEGQLLSLKLGSSFTGCMCEGGSAPFEYSDRVLFGVELSTPGLCVPF